MANPILEMLKKQQEQAGMSSMANQPTTPVPSQVTEETVAPVDDLVADLEGLEEVTPAESGTVVDDLTLDLEGLEEVEPATASTLTDANIPANVEEAIRENPQMQELSSGEIRSLLGAGRPSEVGVNLKTSRESGTKIKDNSPLTEDELQFIQEIGDRKRQADMSPWEAKALGVSQGATFGFSDEIMGRIISLIENEDYAEVRDILRQSASDAATAQPGAYYSGEILGAVAGPGLGAVRAAKQGSELAIQGGRAVKAATGSAAAGKATQLAGQVLSYAVPGAAMGGLDAWGRDQDIETGMALGAAVGPVLAGTIKLGKGALNFLKGIAPTERNAITRAAKKIADQANRPVEEVIEALSKEADTLAAFRRLGLNAEEAAVAVSNAAFKTAKGGAQRLAEEAAPKLNAVKDDAAAQATRFIDDTDYLRTSSPEVGSAYRNFDVEGDGLFRHFDEWTTGANSNTTGPILKEELSTFANQNFTTVLNGSGRKSIDPKDIFIKDGMPVITRDGAKPVSEAAFKKLSQAEKDKITTIGGKHYKEDDLFELANVDGRVAQQVSERLNAEAGGLIKGGLTERGNVVARVKSDLDAGLKGTDPNLAEALATDSTLRGQSSVADGFSKFANKEVKTAQDFSDLQTLIDIELKSTGKSAEKAREAITGAIKNANSGGRPIKGLLNPDGKINEQFKSFLLKNGFAEKELTDMAVDANKLAYLTVLSAKPSMGRIDPNVLETASTEIFSRMFHMRPTVAIPTGILATVSKLKALPLVRQLLSKYGSNQEEMIRKVANMDLSQLKGVLDRIGPKPTIDGFAKTLIDTAYRTTRLTDNE